MGKLNLHLKRLKIKLYHRTSENGAETPSYELLTSEDFDTLKEVLQYVQKNCHVESGDYYLRIFIRASKVFGSILQPFISLLARWFSRWKVITEVIAKNASYDKILSAQKARYVLFLSFAKED